MLAWSEELTEYQRSIRKFVESQVAPLREELELGELSPVRHYASLLQRLWHRGRRPGAV